MFVNFFHVDNFEFYCHFLPECIIHFIFDQKWDSIHNVSDKISYMKKFSDSDFVRKFQNIFWKIASFDLCT